MPAAWAANGFPVSFDEQALRRLCQTYRVAELSLFGSVTRNDFDNTRSDVDVLVEFLPDTPVRGYVWFDQYSLFTLEEALEEMLHRKVDLIDKEELDPYIRDEVINSRVVVYLSSPAGGLTKVREPGVGYDARAGINDPAGADGARTGPPSGACTAAPKTTEGMPDTTGCTEKPEPSTGTSGKAREIKKPDMYLFHMRADCQYLLKTTAGLTYEDFVQDQDKQLVVDKLLVEIGENANRLAPLFRKGHPDLPWKEVINFRYKMAHAYRHTRLYSIWSNKEKIPALLASIEKMIRKVTGTVPEEGQERP